MTPITPPGNTPALEGVATRPKKKKAKTKAAKVPAGKAAGADQKGAPPATEGGGVIVVGCEEPAQMRLRKRRRWRARCSDATGSMPWTTARCSRT
jgi:hypothetical protein